MPALGERPAAAPPATKATAAKRARSGGVRDARAGKQRASTRPVLMAQQVFASRLGLVTYLANSVFQERGPELRDGHFLSLVDSDERARHAVGTYEARLDLLAHNSVPAPVGRRSSLSAVVAGSQISI